MPDGYRQGYGKRAFRKEQTKTDRRADDRLIASSLGNERAHPVPAKKDTRRWCKGKVGVLHQPEWVKWFEVGWAIWYRRTCHACGKVLGIESRKVA